MYTVDLAQDWVVGSKKYAAVDISEMIAIRYKGSQASGIIDIANTTGDITFKHGAAGAEAADTTLFGNGICDLSAEATTYKQLVDGINLSPNWEAWYIAALPDQLTQSGGAGYFMFNITGVQGGTGDCKVANGYALTADSSAALIHSAALSLQGPSTKLHGSDHMVLHELYYYTATLTGTGAMAINVYECDDDNGTKTAIYPALTITSTNAGSAGSVSGPLPITTTKGKRLVVAATAATTLTAATIEIVGRSKVIGPYVRKSKLWAYNQ